MQRRAYGRNVMHAAGEGVDQAVIAAAACDLTRNACAVDLEDHACIIFEMTPEIGLEHDGSRSSESFQPVEQRAHVLQGITQVERDLTRLVRAQAIDGAEPIERRDR